MRDRVRSLIAGANIPGLHSQVVGRPIFPMDKLPAVAVYDAGERVESVSGEYERELAVAVAVGVKVEDDADDRADELCAAIEANLDLRLGGLAQDGRLSQMEVDSSGEGDEQVLVKTMVFMFKYVTAYYNPAQATH